MFKKESLTISSLLAMLVVNVLVDVFGVQVSDENFTQFLQTGTTIVLGLIAWYGRVRLGDVNLFGVRK